MKRNYTLCNAWMCLEVFTHVSTINLFSKLLISYVYTICVFFVVCLFLVLFFENGYLGVTCFEDQAGLKLGRFAS